MKLKRNVINKNDLKIVVKRMKYKIYINDYIDKTLLRAKTVVTRKLALL